MRKAILRSISILLAIILVFSYPAQAVGNEIGDIAQATETSASETLSMDNVSVIGEIPQARTEYSKEFLMSNGLHMTALYPEPIHYENAGTWEDIDNTLAVQSDGTLQNTAGLFAVSFPQNTKNETNISLSRLGYTLSFGMPQKLKQSGDTAVMAYQSLPVSEESTVATAQISAISVQEDTPYPETVLSNLTSRVQYANLYSDTDVIYDLSGGRLKESIVLEKQDDSLQGFRYTLYTGSLLPRLQEDGGIIFYDETEENVVFYMPAPYLVDDAMAISTDVTVRLTGGNGQYQLTCLLPRQWLSSEERQWPVVLDPVIQAGLEMSNIRDASVAENKTFGYTTPVLETGYYSGEGVQRTYLKYRNLPTLSSADTVVAATMTLYKFVTSASTAPIEVHKVLGTWESESITWSNKPAYDTTVEDFVICKEQRYYNWDVTKIVRDWYATGNNYGMLFKASDTVEQAKANNFKQFYSSDYSAYPTYMPTLNIWFRNSSGLESYWDYTSASAGRAGTVYVNLYTGNLLCTATDMGFSGNRMPVSITRVYNANDVSTNHYGIGYGWRFNYNQRIYQWSENSNYYIWEDGDGTRHYFAYQSSGIYKDEDGLSLTLTTTGSGNSKYVLTDKSGNTSHFDTYGRLTALKNKQATVSAVSLTYTSTDGYKIATITDGAGRVYRFSYSGAMLQQISYCGTGSTALYTVRYAYSNNDLVTVTYPDGKNSSYTYHSGRILSAAKDIDGYQLSVSYNLAYGTYAPCRVSEIREYDGTAAGGHLQFSYEKNQTIVRDVVNGTQTVSQFNSWGNTVSVRDSIGRAQFMEFDRNVWDNTSGKGNQLNQSSKLQNTVVNLLKDSSFESGTLWTRDGNLSSMTFSIAGAGYYGLKALYMSGCSDDALRSEGVTAEPGKTYTFSGYVKTQSGAVQLGLGTGSGTAVYSETVTTSGNWKRVEVSYTNNSASAQTVYAFFRGLNGAQAYLDCVQLEQSPTASRYNLLQNGDFRQGITGWTVSGSETGDGLSTLTGDIGQLSSSVYKLSGNFTGTKALSQTITVSGNAGASFVFSGWAKGKSASLANLSGETEKTFALKFTFYNTDGTTTVQTVSFNPNVSTWQYVAGAAVAEKAFSSVSIQAVYGKNANSVCFDGLQVFKEEFGTSYTYDSEGNVISVKDLQSKTTSYEYDTNSNLTKILQDNKAKMTYTYDSYHNVKTATTESGHTYSFAYDTYGNNTQVSISSGTQTLSSSATYTANGNLLATATDALGQVTTYGYNVNTGLLEWVKYPENTDETKTVYSYDSMYRTASATVTTDTGLNLSAAYGYTDDLLTSITTPTTTYNFTYGNFSLRSSVKVGSLTLASYSYSSGNNRLTQLTYGNGDYVRYTYDSQGRVTQKTYEDGAYESYTYDGSGNLATVTDSETGTVTTYYYDLIDRQVGYREKSATIDHTVTYVYNADNNIASMTEVINGVSKTYSYTYDSDYRITSVTSDEGNARYTYDDFGRVKYQTGYHNGNFFLSSAVVYTGSDTATSGQVSSYNGLTYTYDGNGNILTVSDGTNTTGYAYDSQNQLIRENNPALNKTYTWTYDNAGNILSRNEYAYTTGTLGTPTDTVVYSYDCSDWGDLLTAYDGKTIDYDTVGNPVTYDGWTFNWKHGRQLVSMSKDETTWTYTYNADGMRIGRTDGTTTYQYVYNGSSLSQMTVNGNILRFTYDANGIPLTVTCNDDIYYYETNIQGDITAIHRTSGATVVSYTYDAWGNVHTVTSQSDAIGTYNPLLYRGYVYDWEIELYYVSSRYYNPDIGRFINADDIDYLGIDGGLLSYNLFAYCLNNPVNRFDVNGNLSLPNWAKVAIGAAAIAVGVIATAATGGAAAPVLVASLKMAVTSAAIGAAVGAGKNAVNHRVSTGSWNGAGKAALSGAVDGAADGFMWGGISAGATFTTVAAKGAKIQQIGKLKPTNKSGKGYQGVQYKNQRGSLKSFELHFPHKGGSHQQWHWQQNTWNPKTGGITGHSIHWTLFGRRF